MSFSDDDEELIRRAPYIPMSDDLPLFNTDELFFDLDLDTFPILPHSWDLKFLLAGWWNLNFSLQENRIYCRSLRPIGAGSTAADHAG